MAAPEPAIDIDRIGEDVPLLGGIRTTRARRSIDTCLFFERCGQPPACPA